MCLSAVYEVREGNEKLVLEHVSGIESDGASFKLTDIMGDEVVVNGTLKSIDLVRNVIKIEVA